MRGLLVEKKLASFGYGAWDREVEENTISWAGQTINHVIGRVGGGGSRLGNGLGAGDDGKIESRSAREWRWGHVDGGGSVGAGVSIGGGWTWDSFISNKTGGLRRILTGPPQKT